VNVTLSARVAWNERVALISRCTLFTPPAYIALWTVTCYLPICVQETCAAKPVRVHMH
jgi:hypothetical protein